MDIQNITVTKSSPLPDEYYNKLKTIKGERYEVKQNPSRGYENFVIVCGKYFNATRKETQSSALSFTKKELKKIFI